VHIDPAERDSLYRTLAGAVIPRPIAWVSSLSPEGNENLAPYSFFNVVSTSPPVVMFAPANRSGRPDELSDSARNARQTGEFVVSVVTESLAAAMNETSATLAPDESEFDHADLDRAASTAVAPPRVAAADVAFECELYEFIEVGSNAMVLGEVVSVYLDESVTTDGKLDVRTLDAVGRLSGSYYCRTGDRFRMKRPD
jgi:flavin reductase (DIM6/NTAB) family NADH-FMN oxidoreductase RutF